MKIKSCKDCVHVELCQIFGSLDEDFKLEAKNCKFYMPAEEYRHVPCKMGDKAWVVRDYGGKSSQNMRAQAGVITDISFTEDMDLLVTLKHIGRGRWMKNVFPSKELADKALNNGEA